jgi:hypothetical protein
VIPSRSFSGVVAVAAMAIAPLYLWPGLWLKVHRERVIAIGAVVLGQLLDEPGQGVGQVIRWPAQAR